jgi:hypothetical protein
MTGEAVTEVAEVAEVGFLQTASLLEVSRAVPPE